MSEIDPIDAEESDDDEAETAADRVPLHGSFLFIAARTDQRDFWPDLRE